MKTVENSNVRKRCIIFCQMKNLKREDKNPRNFITYFKNFICCNIDIPAVVLENSPPKQTNKFKLLNSISDKT